LLTLQVSRKRGGGPKVFVCREGSGLLVKTREGNVVILKSKRWFRDYQESRVEKLEKKLRKGKS